MPSATFASQSADAIAAAVMRYERKPMRKSTLTTSNKIEELMNVIMNSEIAKSAIGGVI